jgi:hypothetical protein
VKVIDPPAFLAEESLEELKDMEPPKLGKKSSLKKSETNPVRIRVYHSFGKSVSSNIPEGY